MNDSQNVMANMVESARCSLRGKSNSKITDKIRITEKITTGPHRLPKAEIFCKFFILSFTSFERVFYRQFLLHCSVLFAEQPLVKLPPQRKQGFEFFYRDVQPGIVQQV